MKKILTSIVLAVILLGTIAPVIVSAQDAPMEGCTIRANFTLQGGAHVIGDTVTATSTPNWAVVCLFNTIYTVFNYIFYAIMVVSTIMIIIGGLSYITAAGDPEKSNKGKQIIVYALIGFAIAILAKAIPAIVTFFLGT